ncbi:hypothetical protein [Vibrio fluvialis]|uniref:hypothetical protein n=1 Tax=Vibrio fluvialis TaxID=676 RepID=UPI001404E0C6|nr:hypothetical protein [Vibrio fluvialis]NHN73799.1 hypothetical protein [Vibrio fluvialis]
MTTSTTDQVTIEQILNYAKNLDHWVPSAELNTHYPQFSKATIKNLFWKRDEKAGLSRCYRQVGKKGFVNIPLFGCWLAGALPEQQAPSEE